MRALRSLIQQLVRRSPASRYRASASSTKSALANRRNEPASYLAEIAASRRLRRASIPDPVMFVLVAISLTSVIGYRYYNQPGLKVDSPAPQTERAPRTESVLDEESTRQERNAAETGSVQVLKIDAEANQSIQQKLDTVLADIEQMRQLAGEFPFADEAILSLPSQRYLRSTSEAEWQQIAEIVERPGSLDSEDLSADESSAATPSPSEPLSERSTNELATERADELAATLAEPTATDVPAEAETIPSGDSDSEGEETVPVEAATLAFQQAIAELQTYRQRRGDLALQSMLAEILLARQGYKDALSAEVFAAEREISVPAQQTLLGLHDEAWRETRQGLTLATERMLGQGIPHGLPESLIEQAARMQLRSLVPQQIALPPTTEILTSLLEPNLVEDRDATKLQAAQAVEQVDEVRYTVEKGEIIVEQGEVIDRRTFVLLDEFGKTDRGIDWQGLILTAGVVTGAIGIFEFARRRTNVRLRCRDRLLLCLLSVVSLSSPTLAIREVPQTNFAVVGLLVSSFYNPAVAVTQVSLLTGLSAFGSLSAEGGPALTLAPLLAGAMGGLIAAAVAGRLRSREELAFLGCGISLTQGAVYLIATLIPSAAAGTIWSVQLASAAIFGLSGLAWCVVALGVSPYLERLFDLVTPIRLAELANPNRPLLKRLATQAPGTFQHTLFVASLAEAAARELHANVELVRTGTLYHDIGKMHDPLGFIENQMGGPNKHDTINNPQISAQIIKKHVSEGLVMARKHGLPQAVRDFIPEHQGTILISYFYFQAKQQAKANNREIIEADFRYDGPVPQSRETGIVMLADACEAALRSLKDTTSETAFGMVNKIFKARWQDNQLAESGLRREELSIVAEVFVRVWQQYNHQRIAYPKAALDTSRANVPGSEFRVQGSS